MKFNLGCECAAVKTHHWKKGQNKKDVNMDPMFLTFLLFVVRLAIAPHYSLVFYHFCETIRLNFKIILIGK